MALVKRADTLKEPCRFPYEWKLSETTFTKDKGKVFSCFACGGGSTMGYKLAGFDVIGCNEIDPRMNKVYVENHHPKYNFVEGIQTFKLREDLPEELYNLDVLDGSPPCFVAGTKVLTSEGYKNIEDIQCSDFVLTHKNRYRQVTSLMRHRACDLYEVRISGCKPLVVTSNHPFYVRRMTREGKYGKRAWGNPEWVRVKDFSEVRTQSGTIKELYFAGIPVCQEEKLPEWNGYHHTLKMPHNGYHTYNSHIIDVSSCAFWKLVGRWFGDGWQRDPRKETIICCSKLQKDEVATLINKAGFSYTLSEQRTTFRFTIAKVELYEFIKRFGHGAENKHITDDILNLPKAQLSEFLSGYLSADGCYDTKYDKWTCSSVSENLILGLQRIVAKLYHQSVTFNVRKNNTSIIEGRRVNTKTIYSIAFFANKHIQQHAFYEDGYLWTPIRKFTPLVDRSAEVFNFSVNEDESYTVNNVACHNCSSFSMAGQREKAWGKKKKFKEGQVAQVLDTLFFDFIDLAEKLQPKVVIAENVRGLLQGNAKNYVREIYNAFDKAGYYLQHFLLNGADMGLPQTRQRVFFVCLRKDLSAPFMRMIDMFHSLPHITMSFNCRKIPVKEICDYKGREIPKGVFYYWNYKTPSDRCVGDVAKRIKNKLTMFNLLFVRQHQICPTLPSKEDTLIHYEKPLYFSTSEVCKISSFPLDYNFLEELPHYICGMSVPPIMMANVATNVYEQWLSKLK